ncbi:MAG: hypothetical protein AAF716_06440 [Cyanobacteria bacterium P01_D01_bin.1]
MSGSNQNDSPIVQIVASVVIALLVGGSAPWWWQEFFSKDTPDPASTERIEPISDSSTTASPVQASPTPVVPNPEPPAPRRTSISVAYRGDYYGCSLPVAISVAGKQVYPQGAIYQISDVEVGQQGYQISGQIDCPTVGSCQVFGEGTIDVVSNGVYYMIWQNTALGQCSAMLQANI